ncbi:MAG: fucose isomerase, partial [Clostridia bacterium]|nr:fucose isomerase [Clostridia bacterium]
MLKGISPLIPPELLKILAEMGHGDEIVIADGNFPGASIAKNLIRLDGHRAVEVLEAILKLFPLDTYEKPVYLMEKV